MDKSEISKLYNVVKIISAKELAQLSKTYKDNKETIIVLMCKKEAKARVPKYFTEFAKRQEAFNMLILTEIREIKVRLAKIENRLDKHEQLFKQHGWM